MIDVSREELGVQGRFPPEVDQWSLCSGTWFPSLCKMRVGDWEISWDSCSETGVSGSRFCEFKSTGVTSGWLGFMEGWGGAGSESGP